MRCSTLYICLLSSVALSACTTSRPLQISYDDPQAEPARLETEPPKPVQVVEIPKPLPLPGQLKPLPGQDAIGVLVASLDNAQPEVTAAVLDALRETAKQPLTTKDAWREWWSKNKGGP